MDTFRRQISVALHDVFPDLPVDWFMNHLRAGNPDKGQGDYVLNCWDIIKERELQCKRTSASSSPAGQVSPGAEPS